MVMKLLVWKLETQVSFMSMLWSWKWKCSWLARSPSQPLTSADLVNSEISTRKLQWLLNIQDTITIPHKECELKCLNIRLETIISASWPCRPCHQEILLIWWALSPSCTIHSVLKRFVMCTLHYELCNRSNSLRIMDYAQCRTQYALCNLHCALCSIQWILSYLVCTKLCGTGRVPKQKTENFQRGGGESFIIQKFLLHIF